MSPFSRSGFSLIEQVVAIASVAVVAAVVVPTVVGQLDKSESSRIKRDLLAVERATKDFRTDVGYWPGNLIQLRDPLAGEQLDAFGQPLLPTVRSGWKGPYFEPRTFTDVEGELRLTSTAGTYFSGDLGLVDWADASSVSMDRYLTVEVHAVNASHAVAVDLAMDGADDPLGGRLRWRETGEGRGVLTYLAGPVGRGAGSMTGLVDLPSVSGVTGRPVGDVAAVMGQAGSAGAGGVVPADAGAPGGGPIVGDAVDAPLSGSGQNAGAGDAGGTGSGAGSVVGTGPEPGVLAGDGENALSGSGGGAPAGTEPLPKPVPPAGSGLGGDAPGAPEVEPSLLEEAAGLIEQTAVSLADLLGGLPEAADSSDALTAASNPIGLAPDTAAAGTAAELESTPDALALLDQIMDLMVSAAGAVVELVIGS